MEKPFFLRRGDIVAVEGTGTALTVDGGHTWITQHGDITTTSFAMAPGRPAGRALFSFTRSTDVV